MKDTTRNSVAIPETALNTPLKHNIIAAMFAACKASGPTGNCAALVKWSIANLKYTGTANPNAFCATRKITANANRSFVPFLLNATFKRYGNTVLKSDPFGGIGIGPSSSVSFSLKYDDDFEDEFFSIFCSSSMESEMP